MLLILANKQDLKDAMTADELIVSFSLGEIKNHKWHLQVRRG